MKSLLVAVLVTQRKRGWAASFIGISRRSDDASRILSSNSSSSSSSSSEGRRQRDGGMGENRAGQRGLGGAGAVRVGRVGVWVISVIIGP